MRHGQTIQNSAKAFIAFAFLGLVGACADTTNAPEAEAPLFVAPANYLTVGNSIVFTVDNANGTTTRLEDHLLYIPAGAICDPATSGYGASMWDQPCNPLQGSVTITATVLAGPKGEPYIDFQPSMRFAPNKNVMLFFREGQSQPTQLIIKWCDNAGNCLDESLTDPSLKPFRINSSNIIGRRIKHFTGYNIGYGESCPGTVVDNGDGTYWCETGEEGFTRRSGYMVASGEDVTELMKDKEDRKEQ